MSQIKQLPLLLAQQIAAGEVIERPASVLKELLENSIDSGAKQIQIDISGGGVQCIRVVDDGYGIAHEDLPLAIAPHATSKISELADLNHIASLGFRGEALASISSVAKFTLISAVAGQASGWQLQVSNDSQSILQPCPHPVGTTVIVEDLFFNTPARRKFLKSTQTEFENLYEVVRRIALGHYQVGLHFRHHQQTQCRLSAASNEMQIAKRISKVFSRQFVENAVKIDVSTDDLRVWGMATSKAFSRSQADWQYMYVNGRFVKDPLLRHALRQAYQESLPVGRYSGYLIYLELDPAEVDVNVHPCKYEVRFHDARRIHDFVYSAVKQALTHDSSIVQPELLQEKAWIADAEKWVNESTPSYQFSPKVLSDSKVPSNLLLTPLIILEQRYAVLSAREQTFLLDLRVAQETLIFYQLQAAFDQKTLVVKPLLLPQSVMLTADEIETCLQQQENLAELGVSIQALGPNTLMLREIPTLLAQINFASFIAALLQHLATKVTLTATEVLALLAKHQDWAAAKPCKLTEVNNLIEELTPFLGKQWYERSGRFCKPLVLSALME